MSIKVASMTINSSTDSGAENANHWAKLTGGAFGNSTGSCPA